MAPTAVTTAKASVVLLVAVDEGGAAEVGQRAADETGVAGDGQCGGG
jgi:hypothetical protein